MKAIMNIIDNSLGIAKNLFVMLLCACVLPFAFALYVLFAVPKILIVICRRFRLVFSAFTVVALLIAMLYMDYVQSYVYVYGFMDHLMYMIGYALNKNALMFIGVLILAMIFPFFIIAWLFKLAVKIDAFIHSFYFLPLGVLKDYARDTARRFNLLSFGSYRKKELFEIREFRLHYSLPL